MELQFVTVIIWLYHLSPTAYTCSHDQDPRGDFQPFYKMVLRGHVFKTLRVPNSLYCLKECKKEARCQSLNHLMGKDTCELNDRTKEATPEDFITDITKLHLKKPKNRVPLGSIPELPAVSRKEIKMSEGQAVSGKYWLSSIKPSMTAFAYCDMKTEDADECTASIPVCEENADGCENTLGSYICICKPGFSDKNRTCEDINECEAKMHHCSANATCNNTKGSFGCACKPGYTGDGQNCTELSMDSKMLSKNEGYLQQVLLFLVRGMESRWLLCWRASLHGWNVSSQFHPRCDGKNNTVTIIEKDEFVFGGFTDIPWDSSGSSAYSSKAFIFSLRDNEGLAPFKSLVKDPSNAIYRHSIYGPTFGIASPGDVHDIHITNNANSIGGSYTRLGYSYHVPIGMLNSASILAGIDYFAPNEVEVFYLDPPRPHLIVFTKPRNISRF